MCGESGVCRSVDCVQGNVECVLWGVCGECGVCLFSIKKANCFVSLLCKISEISRKFHSVTGIFKILFNHSCIVANREI